MKLNMNLNINVNMKPNMNEIDYMFHCMGHMREWKMEDGEGGRGKLGWW